MQLNLLNGLSCMR